MSAESGPPSPRRIVRCATCGRTEPVSALDLSGYMKGGWPRCCGGVMTYFTATDPPTGTRFTHKCSVRGHEWSITFPAGVDVVADGGVICESCRAKQPAVPPT